MGRTEKSQGLAPPAIRKDIRAKQARHIINRTIPQILASNARARKGADSSELIANPTAKLVNKGSFQDVNQEGKSSQYVKRKGQGRRKAKGEEVREGHEAQMLEAQGKKGKRKDSPIEGQLEDLSMAEETGAASGSKETQKVERMTRIITTDSLTAARMLTFPARYDDSPPAALSKKKDKRNVCVLNMASPLRPGGGVLSGATSQEEFLCARTTLLPSLKEDYYRLPEIGGIYTTDVLVFRNSGPLGESQGDLGASERYYIDVISAGMLRFPELEGKPWQVKRLGKKDKEFVEQKMRGVLRMACLKGARRLVLGAWGCGAYGNPVKDIARAWRNVLQGDTNVETKKGKKPEEKETWENIEEVIFAIPSAKMANEFAHEFDIPVEDGPGSNLDEDEEEEEEDKMAEELRAKINEIETQIAQVWNPDLKTRMGHVLDGLRAQLAEREGTLRAEGEGVEVGSTDEEEEEGESICTESDASDQVAHDDEAEDPDYDLKVVKSRESGRDRAIWC